MIAATAFKRLGIVISAVLFGGLAVIGIMAMMIPSERVRTAVQSEIAAVTGLEPGLYGDVSVSLFPTGSISFGHVSLDDGNGQAVITAERLSARLRLLPLFFGQFRISDVRLERPYIAVDFDESGRSNWHGLTQRLASAVDPGTGRDTEATFSEIRIAEGTIVVRDRASGLTETLTDVDLALAWPSISRSFAATGSVSWNGKPIDTVISLGDFGAALAGERSSLKLRLNSALIKIGFDGALSSRPTLRMEGVLAADGDSLGNVLRWTGTRPITGGGFGPFTLKAKTTIASGDIALSGVNVELDGNAAEGAIAFASAGRRTLQGTLAAEAVDLTPYIGTMRLLAANERSWNNGQISLDGLKEFDLDLRLSSQSVTLARAKLGRTAIAANLRGGRMTITIGEAQAFGGIVKGAILLAGSPDAGDNGEAGAQMKSQLHFADVDLLTCLSELFNFRRIEGRGDLTVALEAAGGSIMGLAGSLDGDARLVSRNGALVGLNVEQLLRRLERRPLSGAGDFRSGRTPFEKLTVDVKITHGTATIEDVQLTSPKVRLDLAGTASIPARDFDLKGVAALVPAADAKEPGSFELPFVVHGPWDDPIMLPDTQALIQRSPAASPLLDAVRNRSTRESVRSAIERLTGGGLTLPAPPP